MNLGFPGYLYCGLKPCYGGGLLVNCPMVVRGVFEKYVGFAREIVGIPR